MKLKRLFSVIGLGLFAAVSAGAGVALSSKPKAEAVKADTNTWMVRFDLCLASASGWDDINSIRLHYWGDGIGASDAYASHMFYNVHEFYGVNLSLTDSQKIEGACWVINRESEGDKWSVNITKFGADDITFLDKDTDACVIQYQFGDGSWIDDGGTWKWPLSNEHGEKSAYFDLSVGVEDPVSYHFTKNPEKNIFELKNFVFSSQTAVSVDVDGSINFNGIEYMFDEASLQNYETSGNPNWWWMYKGTYDFFLTSGSLEIRKQVSPVVESYIYYVLEPTKLSTNDKIYSWGGNEQFGPWSGTRVDSVAGVETYFSNEVLKFEGTAKTIYKIPVDIGYPAGDTNFVWNNGEGTWQSPTGTLVAGAAYWYVASANADAGKAIDFLIAAEAKRNAAGSYSVCNISKPDAEALVGAYNALTEDQRAYVDSSKVYTWTDSSKSTEADISYRNVVVQLGKIAEIAVAGSPMTITGSVGASAKIDTTVMIAVISIIAIVSISSIAVLVVIKKRKHN